MTLLGDDPRPWVLAYDLTDDEADAVRPFCGRLQRITRGEPAVRMSEFDVAIALDHKFHDFVQTPRRLLFGSKPKAPSSSWAASSSGGNPGRLSRAGTVSVPAQRFLITDLAKNLGVADLVKRTCAPQRGEVYRAYTAVVSPSMDVRALLTEAADNSPRVLAALFEAGEAPWRPSQSVLWLPESARRAFKEWLSFVFSYWREQEPGLFPRSNDWQADDEWSAPEEANARRALAAFNLEEEEHQRVAEERRGTLAAEASAAIVLGDEARTLLTADGDRLVAKVAEVLEGFGFAVTNADDLPEHQAAKKEDLRIQEGEWVAVIEVKGYSRGAKAEGIAQVERAARSYLRNNGHDPDALWYVVNAHRSDNPGTRPLPLQSDPGAVEGFATESNGLVIDTRDLFRLWRRVADGQMDKDEARALLRGAHGRFSFV